MHILTVDVGTSSMRGIVFTREGRALFSGQRAYQPLYLQNGWVEQEPADWESALFALLSQAAEAAGAGGWGLDAIALTSQRSSIIPVDKDMRPLCNAIMWQDKRVEPLCRELERENNWVFKRCGSRVNPVFSGTKMAWLRRERPDLYKKAYKLLAVPDYLLWLLTGRLATDHTYGSRSLLMNLRTRQWDRDLLALFGVGEEKLCPLIEPGSVCGILTKEAAARTGLSQGLPVVTAGGDQQCGAIGQGGGKGWGCFHHSGHRGIPCRRGGKNSGKPPGRCAVQLCRYPRAVYFRIQRPYLLFGFRLVPQGVLWPGCHPRPTG